MENKISLLHHEHANCEDLCTGAPLLYHPQLKEKVLRMEQLELFNLGNINLCNFSLIWTIQISFPCPSAMGQAQVHKGKIKAFCNVAGNQDYVV